MLLGLTGRPGSGKSETSKILEGMGFRVIEMGYVIKSEMSKILTRSAGKIKPLNEKEFVLLSEIGLDQIPAATNFVEFFAENYGVSQSGTWYTLKKLKKERVVDFTEKGEVYKPLSLTKIGLAMLRKQGVQTREIQNVRTTSLMGGI